MRTEPIIINFIQTLVLLIVLFVNYLANSLPLNGITTGELSALYPNYFVPAGITFSIWGIIYLLLIVYVVQMWLIKPAKTYSHYKWFVVAGIGNAGWIFAWHYKMIVLSMLMMLLLLFSLMRLFLITRHDRWTLRVPISVYLGWISVATIANATALLVDLGWKGGMVGEPAWAIIMMIFAAGLSTFIRFRFNDLFFQLVVIWAVTGIYLRFGSSSLALASMMQTVALVLIILMGVSLIMPVVFGSKLKKSNEGHKWT